MSSSDRVLQHLLQPKMKLSDAAGIAECVDEVIEYCNANYRKATMQEQADNAVCEDVLSFARADRNLRVIETPAPRAVLPSGCTSVVAMDIRVTSRGPDDLVFLHNHQVCVCVFVCVCVCVCGAPLS